MSATTDRVERALTEFIHVEPVVKSDPTQGMFWVYSGSGEKYAVDTLNGELLCTCWDLTHHEGICKHVWHVLLTQPDALTTVFD